MTTVSDLPLSELLLALALPFVAGIALGLFFFGGLWWTVQRLLVSAYPGPLALGSLVIRTVITVAGFYWVMDGSWERLLACTAGFLIARVLMVRRLRPVRSDP
jgi:F1F0 ATPase subunit 2